MKYYLYRQRKLKYGWDGNDQWMRELLTDSSKENNPMTPALLSRDLKETGRAVGKVSRHASSLIEKFTHKNRCFLTCSMTKSSVTFCTAKVLYRQRFLPTKFFTDEVFSDKVFYRQSFLPTKFFTDKVFYRQSFVPTKFCDGVFCDKFCDYYFCDEFFKHFTAKQCDYASLVLSYL